jgi:hypothetical protein
MRNRISDFQVFGFAVNLSIRPNFVLIQEKSARQTSGSRAFPAQFLNSLRLRAADLSPLGIVVAKCACCQVDNHAHFPLDIAPF